MYNRQLIPAATWYYTVTIYWLDIPGQQPELGGEKESVNVNVNFQPAPAYVCMYQCSRKRESFSFFGCCSQFDCKEKIKRWGNLERQLVTRDLYRVHWLAWIPGQKPLTQQLCVAAAETANPTKQLLLFKPPYKKVMRIRITRYGTSPLRGIVRSFQWIPTKPVFN